MAKAGRPATQTREQEYAKRKASAAKRNRDLAAAAGEVGELPPVAKPARKRRCRLDFAAFCRAYFPDTFGLPWSDDHRKVIAKIRAAVLEGGLFAVAMPRGSGKALALDTPIPTPSGWTTMGAVVAGDLVYDDQGSPCRVVACTEVQTDQDCYRVAFDDGEEVVCSGNHLWTVTDRYSRKNPLTLRTSEMAGRLVLSSRRGWTEYRYTVPVTRPLFGANARNELVHPYTLGAWLGDGHTTSNKVTIGDLDADEMVTLLGRAEPVKRVGRQRNGCHSYLVGGGWSQIKSPERVRANVAATDMLAAGRGCREVALATGLSLKTVWGMRGLGRCRGLTNFGQVSLSTRLRWLGVLGNKHIPPDYLRASAEDRLELLRGLMDTDGTMSKNGSTAEYVTKLPALRDGVMELLASLGYKRRCREKVVMGGTYYRITFTPSDGRRVFNLTRKAARQQRRDVRVSATRRIVAIDRVGPVPVRCIQVDSPSSLYLCGRGMVPTHNSTLAETSCLWALLYAHRSFVVLVGADQGKAEQMLDSIKVELETNELLLEDFPEVCYPIHKLDRIAQRAKGQTYRGDPTYVNVTAGELVLPTIRPHKTSGACVKAAGLTGSIRGMKHKTPEGLSRRPDLVVADDVQTDESARSASQCAYRERVLSGAVLGMAGPGKTISGIMPCTVIAPGDLADRILDPQLHPRWNGERTKMLYSFPSDAALWETYAELRRDGFRRGDQGRAATEFYRANRKAMDAGAVAAWPERHRDDELSAVQHAMNLYLDDPVMFAAECQNDPLPLVREEADALTPDAVAARVNRHARGVVPGGLARLTAFVDVQADLLYYAVCAWADDATGAVVAYGTYPEQRKPYFTLRDADPTLARAVGTSSLEGGLFAGLERLAALVLGAEYPVDGGAGVLKVERCLVDANWGQSTDVVYRWCRQSAFAAVLTPSHGKGITAGGTPIDDWPRHPGERRGPGWVQPVPKPGRVRHVVYDANHWKTHLAARLGQPPGERGALALFGDAPGAHRLLADHACAEYRVRTSGRGREVDEWKQRPHRPDNHWLDCLAGCCVAASMLGVGLPGVPAGQAQGGRRRVSFAEMQARARG